MSLHPGSQSKVGLGRVVLLECAQTEVNRCKALSFIGGQSAVKVGYGVWQCADFGMDMHEPQYWKLLWQKYRTLRVPLEFTILMKLWYIADTLEKI